MNLNNDGVEFSKKDLSKNINLPNYLTPELAEIVGIILGDGHLEYNKKYSNNVIYLVQVSGSSSEDIEYYKNEINPLFYKLFNTKFNIFFRRNDELDVRLYSKAITTFIKNLGVKSGRKVDNNGIPDIILNSNDEIKKSFLRGVFDTEGSITFKKDYFKKHSKPIISLAMKSADFVLQLRRLLEELDFVPIFYKEEYLDNRSGKITVRYRIELAGKKNLKKYLEIIGFRNPRHLTKIAIWEKFGFYPPGLIYKQRKDILDDKLNPLDFYL